MLFRLIEIRFAKVVVFLLLTLSLPLIYIVDMLSLSGKMRIAVISLFLSVFAFIPGIFNKYGWADKNSINEKLLRCKKSTLEHSKWGGIVFAVLSFLCVAFWNHFVDYFGLISIQLPILALAYFILEYSLIDYSAKFDISDEQ